VCSGDSSISCISDAQCASASAGACSGTVTLGEEVWAFIPKHVLPYLKYTADANYGGCHLYSVDLTPYIFDASIGAPGSGDVSDVTRTPSHWRTILIGGMRYGGACKNATNTCTNCVKTPVTDLGYSSYFALDITNQNNPTLLWEYSNPELGFATPGPAVVKISALSGGSPDKFKNGHWFVILGSGPTGPIDTTYKQFLGQSDQPLKFFVLNLKDGSLAATIPTGISNAFTGSMFNATLDTDLDYQDDVVYVPYVKLASDGTTWTDGGVGRLSTNESFHPDTDWTWSTVMDGIGPVTSAVTKLQNNSTHTLWVFFGTGRYYFEKSGATDDGAGQRQIFGVKEPCFDVSGFHGGCSSSLSWCGALASVGSTTCGVVTNVTSTLNIPSNPDDSDFKGWYINLDGDAVPDASFRAERVITDPLATTSGIVFFTTYKPYSDQCSLGGKSFIWAVKYNTGGGAGSLLQGKALVQVSTGSIEQLNLSSAFTDAGGRKSAGMEGVPPTAQGLSILSSPPPVKRVLHIRER
jgi:type IV pilus assembly protein PilY1